MRTVNRRRAFVSLYLEVENSAIVIYVERIIRRLVERRRVRATPLAAQYNIVYRKAFYLESRRVSRNTDTSILFSYKSLLITYLNAIISIKSYCRYSFDYEFTSSTLPLYNLEFLLILIVRNEYSPLSRRYGLKTDVQNRNKYGLQSRKSLFVVSLRDENGKQRPKRAWRKSQDVSKSRKTRLVESFLYFFLFFFFSLAVLRLRVDIRTRADRGPFVFERRRVIQVHGGRTSLYYARDVGGKVSGGRCRVACTGRCDARYFGRASASEETMTNDVRAFLSTCRRLLVVISSRILRQIDYA
ncbi:hypothetical protein PUN28_004694 [Cardiocondyla obscurior]|uniref:Uncharacterized protein n=1 Tax=Cardiocondyla obscurior TaxID=286306 RepID=A0AAW2GCQ5_9HYME